MRVRQPAASDKQASCPGLSELLWGRLCFRTLRRRVGEVYGCSGPRLGRAMLKKQHTADSWQMGKKIRDVGSMSNLKSPPRLIEPLSIARGRGQ